MLETKEHPGCMVSGYVLVNRVPGNFHIEARSLHHNLNAAMTNLSHVVNHLSFGTPLASSTERQLSKYAQFQANYPLDGGRFISCLLYTSPSPRDGLLSRMPSSA